MTTGKTIALTLWTFVSKVMSLLFNMLSRLVIAFLPRSNHLLISWLQLPSAVILEPPKIKSVTVSIVSPSICHEMMGPDTLVLLDDNITNLVEMGRKSQYIHFSWEKQFSTFSMSTQSGGPVVLFFAYCLCHCQTS